VRAEVSVGAAEGCDLLIFKIKRSQPSRLCENLEISTVIGENAPY
jgi:hypothetical protein